MPSIPSSGGVSPVLLCELHGSVVLRRSESFTRQNNVEEIYSLIKFLRISPLNDWGTFSSSIAKPVKAGKPVRALKRLQVRRSWHHSSYNDV